MWHDRMLSCRDLGARDEIWPPLATARIRQRREGPLAIAAIGLSSESCWITDVIVASDTARCTLTMLSTTASGGSPPRRGRTNAIADARCRSLLPPFPPHIRTPAPCWKTLCNYLAPQSRTCDAASGYPVEGWNHEPAAGWACARSRN